MAEKNEGVAIPTVLSTVMARSAAEPARSAE